MYTLPQAKEVDCPAGSVQAKGIDDAQDINLLNFHPPLLLLIVGLPLYRPCLHDCNVH